MKKIIISKRNIRRLIVLATLVVLFALLSLLTLSNKVCEFFATTFSRAWIYFFGNILGWIPVSFYELFLIVAIVGAITFVVYEIVYLSKRKWYVAFSVLLVLCICVFSFLNVYTATATFSYGRDKLPEEVYEEYSGGDFSLEDAMLLAEKVIEQVNEAYHLTQHDADGNIVYPYSFRELSNLLAKEYERLQSDYFSSYTPRGKKIINKTIMSEMHITGVFFAPFGEANINGYENNLYLPHTLAHEQAHGKGVMREYEANLVASYILLTSENPYLRYGALARCMYSALNIVSLYPNSTEIYNDLVIKIDSGITKERQNYSKFYSQFDHLDNIGEFFNDLYLKLNKQNEGTGSYNKPGESFGTGSKDDFDKEIVTVVNFSDTQNLLIKLYKENKL